jgi:hypothetical protein
VQGPVIQQGAFYDASGIPLHASTTPVAGMPTLAAADSLSTF